MSKSGWVAEDWMGLWIAAMIGGGAFLFWQLTVTPVAMVGICAADHAPAICVPRHLMLKGAWLGVYGWAALLLGLYAFFRVNRIVAALAVGVGIAAVVNYNGTQGIIGAALGLIAWLSAITGRAVDA
jgi:hypothetical protein